MVNESNGVLLALLPVCLSVYVLLLRGPKKENDEQGRWSAEVDPLLSISKAE